LIVLRLFCRQGYEFGLWSFADWRQYGNRLRQPAKGG